MKNNKSSSCFTQEKDFVIVNKKESGNFIWEYIKPMTHLDSFLKAKRIRLSDKNWNDLLTKNKLVYTIGDLEICFQIFTKK